jgi:hypothetical protein
MFLSFVVLVGFPKSNSLSFSPYLGNIPPHSEDTSSSKGFLLVAHEPGTTVGGSHIRGSMVRASEGGYEEVDLVLPGTGR